MRIVLGLTGPTPIARASSCTIPRSARGMSEMSLTVIRQPVTRRMPASTVPAVAVLALRAGGAVSSVCDAAKSRARPHT